MLFSTFEFVFFFLPIVFVIFCTVGQYCGVSALSVCLLAASIAFYALWNPMDLVPLFTSICFNYLFYLGIINKNAAFKRSCFAIGLIFNLGLLGYYKYWNFAIQSLFNGGIEVVPQSIPLGISFYTFTQIAFLVDCYYNNYKRNDFINYALFVSYFPHLVCGPIIRFQEIYPQLTATTKFKASYSNATLFIIYFSIGLFKKTVLADPLASYVGKVFDMEGPEVHFDMLTAVAATLSYSLQLYFDFSGYSDMAVGLSHLFGLKIPHNFNSPYQATSIIDFWHRWHITLSNFLKNYLYIPIGGNRSGKISQYRNLLITMLLGGLWHGAAWTFVLWGLYHGVMLVANHLLRDLLRICNIVINAPACLVKIGKTTITFILVSLGWVLFRSGSIDKATSIYRSLFCLHTGNNLELYDSEISVILLGLIIALFAHNTPTLQEKVMAWLGDNRYRAKIAAVAYSIVAAIGLIAMNAVQDFLYSGF